MKRLSLSLALALLALAVSSPVFADCVPAGFTVIGGGAPAYNHIANGIPNRDECWNPQAAVYVTGTTTCGFTSNAYEFNYGGSIYQQFVVPSDMTQQNFTLQFMVDFIDPNNDGSWNKFKAEVWDVTTNTKMGSYSFNGSTGDLYCSLRSISWSGSHAGHTMKVRFTGSKAYTDTYIRVRQIALFQQ